MVVIYNLSFFIFSKFEVHGQNKTWDTKEDDCERNMSPKGHGFDFCHILWNPN